MLPYWIVDAFTDRLFTGNPAAVVLPEKFPADALMQQIAAENNLNETAFAVPEGEDFRLRWFTPTVEVDLCGHATLATAFVLAHQGRGPEFRFHTRSGILTAAARVRASAWISRPALSRRRRRPQAWPKRWAPRRSTCSSRPA